MVLTDKEYLEPIRDFLMTYPHTTPINKIDIDYGQVDETGSDSEGEGNALRLISRIKVRERKSVLGRITETWRINFALSMRRYINDGEQRRDIDEFILQFIQWVTDENRKRGTKDVNPKLPQFSDTEYETISADGGGMTSMLPNERAGYQIALHIDFQHTTSAKTVNR